MTQKSYNEKLLTHFSYMQACAAGLIVTLTSTGEIDPVRARLKAGTLEL